MVVPQSEITIEPAFLKKIAQVKKYCGTNIEEKQVTKLPILIQHSLVPQYLFK